MSIKRCLNNADVVHIYNGILLDHKKNEILPFVTTWIDLEGMMLIEKSQTKKDKYCMSKQNWRTPIDTESGQVVTQGEGFGEVGEKGEGIKKHKWVVIRYNRDAKHCIGTTVNNIVITMHGARWGLETARRTLCKVYDCLTTMPYTWNQYKITL